ncbi:MAG TPA: glycine cleavage system aminomethyltransferase GcvT [bacterium]|nr:glycine cleavage system aminomethyltransferase GcvT [bacterium]
MEPKKTPLFESHTRLNALMAGFAGWDMPIHYGSIISEALHTRKNCSAFDISHMGEFFIKEDPSKSTLDKIITVPVVKMGEGKCRYGFLLNENGGIIDDLIVYRIKEDEWMVVVNASNEERDALHFSAALSASASFDNRSGAMAKLDIQGPSSPAVMEELAGGGIGALKYFSFGEFDIFGESCIISRTGYTGEAGFEVYAGASKSVEIWDALLAKEGVKPAGLGARDILRLEAGLPLHGSEMDENITPLEAGFGRVIDFEKEFTGRDALLKQREVGVKKNLRGFLAAGRRQPRHGSTITVNGKEAGVVTSGCFSPHLNRGIGAGYIDTSAGAEEGAKIEIGAGKPLIDAEITAMPFIKTRANN